MKVTGAQGSPLSRFNWRVAAARWAEQVEPLVKDRLRQAAPVGKGPGAGRLKDSIRSERVAGAASVVLTFTANVPYAGFVLSGTAPHDIRPRNAQALRWDGPGGPMFARVVHHPGTRPDPFPERAIRPLEAVIQAAMRSAITAQLQP
ncbi:HK97-gp10 family putative phage morphogenesis protein [Streptacidiphilus sp. PAMC 29251]